MSATSMQRTIYKAYKTVAGVIGFKHTIYRPYDYMLHNTDLANYVGNVKATFSLDEKYKRPMKFTVPIWEVYADGNQLQVGDILQDPVSDRTFFMVSMQSMLPMQAIEATDEISVTRVAYTKVDGLSVKGETIIGKGIVANKQPSGSQQFDNNNPAPQSANGQWDFYCYVPRGMIEIDDIITDKDGKRIRVKYAEWYPLGYKLHCVEVNKNGS